MSEVQACVVDLGRSYTLSEEHEMVKFLVNGKFYLQHSSDDPISVQRILAIDQGMTVLKIEAKGEDLQCPGKISAEISLVFREEPSQAKITNSWLEFGIQQNVAGFDISVYNSEV